MWPFWGADRDAAPGAQPAGGLGQICPFLGKLIKNGILGASCTLFGGTLGHFGVKLGHFGGELWSFWGADRDATPGAQPAGDAQILG